MVYSLGPGSAVGKKGKKRGEIGKIWASEASSPDYLSARFARQPFSPFPPNAEPGPRLNGLLLRNVIGTNITDEIVLTLYAKFQQNMKSCHNRRRL